MNTKTPMPDDAVLQASVDRIEIVVLEGTRRNRRRRRRATIGIAIVAGAALFTGGLAVGAATLAPGPVPDHGTGSDSRGEVSTVFALDCYDSSTPPQPIFKQSYGTNAEASTAIKDPVSVCNASEQKMLTQEAIQTEAETLHRQGQTCGYINVIGDRNWLWQVGSNPSDPASLFLTDGTPTTTPTGCGEPVTIPAPSLEIVPLAACTQAQNWVAVYPRGPASAADVCSALGEDVWGR